MKDLMPHHAPRSVAGLTLAAAINEAPMHAAKHAERFPATEHPVVRESDGSAIDAALRSDRSADSIESERRARKALEVAQAKLRGLDRIVDPKTPGYADAKLRAQANVDTCTRRVAWYAQRYGTAAVVAVLLILPAFFPAKSPALDLSLPSVPHEAGKQAPIQPGVTDDAWGGLSFWA